MAEKEESSNYDIEENIKKKLDDTLLELITSKTLNLGDEVSVSIKFSELNDEILDFLKKNNAKIRNVLKLIRKIAVDIKVRNLLTIAKDSRVLTIQYDSLVKPT